MGYLLIILPDFVAILGISTVVNVDKIFFEQFPGTNSLITHFIDAFGNFPDESVGTGTGTVGAHKNQVPRFGNIERRGQADRRRTGIGIAESG